MLATTEAYLQQQATEVLTLVVNTINGVEVEGLFTSRAAAQTYLFRIATLFGGDIYFDNLGDVEDRGPEPNLADLQEDVLDLVRNYYKLLPVTHLDPSKPIYVLFGANRRVAGTGRPENYLSHQIGELGSLTEQEWIDCHLITLDPALPPLVERSE